MKRNVPTTHATTMAEPRNAELAEDKNSAHKAEVRSVPDFTWTLTIGRVSPEGELRQKRVLLLVSKPKGPLRQERVNGS